MWRCHGSAPCCPTTKVRATKFATLQIPNAQIAKLAKHAGLRESLVPAELLDRGHRFTNVHSLAT
jgi:hypothetical protein